MEEVQGLEQEGLIEKPDPLGHRRQVRDRRPSPGLILGEGRFVTKPSALLKVRPAPRSRSCPGLRADGRWVQRVRDARPPSTNVVLCWRAIPLA